MRRLALRTALAALVVLLPGCDPGEPPDALERHAESYVRLALDLGRLRPAEVDAYFGPPRLDRREAAKGPEFADIEAEARKLQAAITAMPPEADPVRAERRARLEDKVGHLLSLLQVLADPRALGFVEEARLLYGIELRPAVDPDAAAALAELDALLPGSGPLPFRLASFRNRFVVPGDRREAVFERALEECRERTLAHWELPRDKLIVEWDREVQAAWYRYRGAASSTLQVNPLAVAYIGEAIDVACHEAYPGHHAQFALFGTGDTPVEESVVLLRSPDSVLREGAAILAVSLAFPPAERLAFERDVLFPLAGLPVSDIEKHARVHALVGRVASAVIPIVLEYRDGDLGPNTATFRLEREALVTSPAQLLAFVDEYGAYSLGYTSARAQLQAYLEGRAAAGDDPWSVLREVLTRPRPEAVFQAAD